MPKPYNPHDKYLVKAKAEGFRARSVYKLQELDEKFKLLKPNLTVLDIGAAPGSWLQYTSSKITPNGKALGLDLQEIDYIAPNVVTKVCDIFAKAQVNQIIQDENYSKFDLILSDIMPNTTGIKSLDQKQSILLSQQVFNISKDWLKPKGTLVMKVFDGEGFANFIKLLKNHFNKVSVAKVKASRDRSREVYIVCF